MWSRQSLTTGLAGRASCAGSSAGLANGRPRARGRMSWRGPRHSMCRMPRESMRLGRGTPPAISSASTMVHPAGSHIARSFCRLTSSPLENIARCAVAAASAALGSLNQGHNGFLNNLTNQIAS